MLKIPPHNIEAEQAVLWSLLIDKDGFLSIGDILMKEDFYEERHAQIFDAILELYTKNRPVDILTVAARLSDKKQLDGVGGELYMMEITSSVPTTANIFEYATIVKNKSIHRKLIKAGNEILAAAYDEEKNINSILEIAEQSLFKVTQVFIRNKLIHISEILEDRFKLFSEMHEHPEKVQDHRLYSNFATLDNVIGGFQGGDMVILAARPSMGKTAFALNLAQKIGGKDKTVAIFSLEMSKEQLTDRLISANVGINSWKLAKGEIEDSDFIALGESLENLGKTNIYIDDSGGGNLLEFKSKARRLKMESGLDIIIIDYLQLMSHGNGNHFNRVQEISEISRGIKSLARELNIPILALSQLSRAVESREVKKPQLSDLRESGSIEQDADIVMMLYRDDYYDSMSEKRDIIEISVKKNRNGPTGTVEMKFEKANQKFLEIDTQHDGYEF